MKVKQHIKQYVKDCNTLINKVRTKEDAMQILG